MESDYVFKKLIKNKTDRDFFYNNICTFEWNENQDMGYPLKKATRERIKLFPEYEKLILHIMEDGKKCLVEKYQEPSKY